MRLRRREFLKFGSLGLAAAGLAPRSLFPSVFSPAASAPSTLLRSQLLDGSYPFPYDDRYFACAERIYNVRPAGSGLTGSKAGLNLVPAPGKKLDIRVQTADTLAGLANPKDVFSFSGVNDVLDVELTADDGPRLYYQVFYREGSGSWLALYPKSFKLPTVSLDGGGEIKVLVITDDHTFDDGDYVVSKEYAAQKLNGDYVNELLRAIRSSPAASISSPLGVLKNGFCLAQSLRYIMDREDPDIILNLGDTNGIGAGYKWQGLGLPTVGLTDKDFDNISYTLWMRMRKMYSAITPHVPMYLAQGNHDGEEQWNPARFHARDWRQRLFTMPDDSTYREGGHPDGMYYGFSWGSDSLDRGGVRFLMLHTTGFTGDRYPATPEGWTLGEAQRQWFEQTVNLGGRHWVFACQHHALGGWPAGSSEDDKTMAYGRGPLFTHDDYVSYANPDRVEQSALTQAGRDAGLRAILYGHDHIFYQKVIGQWTPGKDMLAVCCGSTKYMGETAWWNGPFWLKNYGSFLGAQPKFWGPPGITRLTIRSDQTTFDYLATAITSYSNHPPEAAIGALLSTKSLTNPPPKVEVDHDELDFVTDEGRPSKPDVLRIRNAGGGCLRYELKPDASWVFISRGRDESWGEWDSVKIHVHAKSYAEGEYQAKIKIISNDMSGPPKEVKVRLSVGPPVPYPPQDLQGAKTSAASGTGDNIVLTWQPNPLNKDVRRYRVFTVAGGGQTAPLAEVGGRTFSFVFAGAVPSEAYGFAVAAVDRQNLEGLKAFVLVK